LDVAPVVLATALGAAVIALTGDVVVGIAVAAASSAVASRVAKARAHARR
jgi:hypothetical protein